MSGEIRLLGKCYPIVATMLHLPFREVSHWLYLWVAAEPNCGFALWGAELPLLKGLDDLDRQRLHVKRNGETYDDDTLATDIIGMDDITDQNYWNMADDGNFFYGAIQVDFHRIAKSEFRCRVECLLTDGAEPEPAPEACPILGTAEFTVDADENGPFDRSGRG